jgi:prepilin-type N-terminal cleavage/methylation domain-containing protein
MLTELLARLRRLSSDDRGFPLVEMLVAIVVLGVITVPIGNVVISALKHTDDTSSRLTESHDAQLSAAWFAQDVANFGTPRPAWRPTRPATAAVGGDESVTTPAW